MSVDSPQHLQLRKKQRPWNLNHAALPILGRSCILHVYMCRLYTVLQSKAGALEVIGALTTFLVSVTRYLTEASPGKKGSPLTHRLEGSHAVCMAWNSSDRGVWQLVT